MNIDEKLENAINSAVEDMYGATPERIKEGLIALLEDRLPECRYTGLNIKNTPSEALEAYVAELYDHDKAEAEVDAAEARMGWARESDVPKSVHRIPWPACKTGCES